MEEDKAKIVILSKGQKRMRNLTIYNLNNLL